MATTDAQVISIAWTLFFGFLLPGLVLAYCPFILLRFGRWALERGTTEGYALTWGRRGRDASVELNAITRAMRSARSTR